MGVIRFIIIVICLGVMSGIPHAESTAAPAKPKSDQELLNSKFEKMQQVLSEEATPEKRQAKERAYKPTNSKDILVLSFKIMFYIAVLSGLLYLAIRAFKKGALGQTMVKHHKSIEILESAHLAQHKTVNLVKVLDRVLVLGVTENSVNLLTVIDDEASVKRIAANNQETASSVAGNFSASVNSFLSKFKKENRGVPLSAYSKEGEE